MEGRKTKQIEGVKALKQVAWEDDWRSHVRYEVMLDPVPYPDFRGGLLKPDFPPEQTMNIIYVMEQLERGMSVYKAFMKGLEAMACTVTFNCTNEVRDLLLLAEKRKIKNVKKKIFDEELNDVLNDIIEALRRGYAYYCSSSGK